MTSADPSTALGMTSADPSTALGMTIRRFCTCSLATSFDGGRIAADDATHHAAAGSKATLGLVAIDTGCVHDDRELDGPAGSLEQRARLLTRDVAHLGHDALAAIDELHVRGAQVDHQVAE